MSEIRTNLYGTRRPIAGRSKSGRFFVRFVKPDVRFSDVHCIPDDVLSFCSPGAMDFEIIVKFNTRFQSKILKVDHCVQNAQSIYIENSLNSIENNLISIKNNLISIKNGQNQLDFKHYRSNSNYFRLSLTFWIK